MIDSFSEFENGIVIELRKKKNNNDKKFSLNCRKVNYNEGNRVLRQ